MSADELKLDYPEHLNPFHHRRNTLARSFRGIKKAIVRSFTGKDKDKPTIRPKPESATLRNVMSMPPSYSEPPILFPRSRFSERLSKTDALRTTSRRNNSSLDRLEDNPFEGNDQSELKSNVNGDTITGISPIPAERKSKRRKKKAPIPPGSVSGSVNESKWSLVSTDSEMSSVCYSESEIDYVLNNNVNEKNEEILKITREIAKFTEDTNNNSISDQTRIENDHIDDTKSDNNHFDDTKSDNNHIDDTKSDNNNIDDKCDQNDKSEIHQVNKHEEDVTDAPSNTINTNCEDLNDKITCKCDDNSCNKCNNCKLLNEVEVLANDSGFIEDNQKLSPGNSNNSSTEVLETLDRNNSAAQSSLDEKQDNEEEGKKIDEKETLRLSHDDGVNKTESETTESRSSVKGTIDFFEHTYASPSPKVRKNILTKEKLLGAEEI